MFFKAIVNPKLALWVFKKELGTFLVFSLGFSAFAEEKPTSKHEEVRFWHSMSGGLQEKLDIIIEKYHASQNKVRVNATYKGNYTDALNGMVAAYRGGKQPHITQVFEVGTQSMMKSGAIVNVEELFQKAEVDLNKNDFLPPVLGYYTTADGKLASLPFNSSTPILYYNKDILDQVGITKIPETWEEMFEASKIIKAKSGACGLVFGWQSWTLIENFTTIQDIPLAVPENGFAGLDVKMNLTHPDITAFISKVADAVHKKEFLFAGRRTEAPRRAFIAKNCAFLVDSSASVGAIKKTANFKWDTAFQPHLAGRTAKNSLIGGASLWVMKGHSDKDYLNVVDFMKFLSSPAIVAEWHQGNGYIPVTQAAYKLSRDQGFYVKEPNQETAVKQLVRGGEVTWNSRGIRLGNFSQIREVIEEHLEKIWDNRLSVVDGLTEANEAANLVLSRFAKLRGPSEKKAPEEFSRPAGVAR